MDSDSGCFSVSAVSVFDGFLFAKSRTTRLPIPLFFSSADFLSDSASLSVLSGISPVPLFGFSADSDTSSACSTFSASGASNSSSICSDFRSPHFDGRKRSFSSIVSVRRTLFRPRSPKSDSSSSQESSPGSGQSRCAVVSFQSFPAFFPVSSSITAAESFSALVFEALSVCFSRPLSERERRSTVSAFPPAGSFLRRKKPRTPCARAVTSCTNSFGEKPSQSSSPSSSSSCGSSSGCTILAGRSGCSDLSAFFCGFVSAKSLFTFCTEGHRTANPVSPSSSEPDIGESAKGALSVFLRMLSCVGSSPRWIAFMISANCSALSAFNFVLLII